MASGARPPKKSLELDDPDFENRILYRLEGIPEGRNPTWDKVLNKGVPTMWSYHRTMKEYGWMSWSEWQRMPLLVKEGLIKCINIDNEWQNQKLEEAQRDR